MELRVRGVLIYLGLISTIFSSFLKFPLASITTMLILSVVGCFIFYTANIIIAILKHPEGSKLLFHKPIPSGTSTLSYMLKLSYHKEALLIGFFEGLYFGYNVSVMYNAYFAYSIIHSTPLITNAISSIIAYNALFSAENLKEIQELISTIYEGESSNRSIKNLLFSSMAGYSLGEFMGIGGTMYALFFEVLYYCVYVIASEYKELCIVIVVVYIILCIFHYFYFIRGGRYLNIPTKEEEIITV